MRLAIALSVTALLLAAAPVKAQVYVTGISATIPDPDGKVPAFNVVSGAGIPTWSDGLSQAVLVHGQTYDYCVSLASATADGSASVSFSIKRGKVVIQSATLVKANKFQISSNGVWYWCANETLPDSPGAATLTGTVSYLATGATKHVTSHITADIVLQ